MGRAIYVMESILTLALMLAAVYWLRAYLARRVEYACPLTVDTMYSYFYRRIRAEAFMGTIHVWDTELEDFVLVQEEEGTLSS